MSAQSAAHKVEKSTSKLHAYILILSESYSFDQLLVNKLATTSRHRNVFYV